MTVVELQLTRAAGDSTRYELERVGRLRLGGWGSRHATASAGRQSWELVRRGVLRMAVEATDAAGDVVGEFRAKALGRGGTLRWCGRELTLDARGFWRTRYVVAEGGRPLASVEGNAWGKRPLKVSVDDDGSIDPGLLLFTTFVVRALVKNDSASASAPGAVVAGS